MKIETIDLDPGLYFVATPIGAARDITLRALDILSSADVLAAEDTRTLRRLMQIHGLPVGDRQVFAYHDHNGAKMRPRLLDIVAKGQSVAYASDAGTPTIADPGFQLAKAALAEGLRVTSAPGPAAVTMALSVSGLPTDRFLFAGFPPATKGARQTWLHEVLAVPATLVLYDSAKRLQRTLKEIAEAGGAEREAAICRELTKRFEEVRRGTVHALIEALEGVQLKGEIVLVVDRGQKSLNREGLEELLLGKLKVMSLKDAVVAVAQETGLPRRDVYQTALTLDGQA